MTQRVDPLTRDVSIVDSAGKPTAEFQRKWSQQHGVNDTIPDLSTAEKVSLVLDKLGAQPNQLLIRGSAQWRADMLTAILDVLVGSSRGTLLFRGAAEWEGLAAGTSGYVLTTKGTGANPEWDEVPQTGFGFFVGGLMTDHELLGGCTFPEDITFTDSDPKTVVECIVPPTADADLTLVANPVGISPSTPATVATIHFAAGAFTATVTWTPSPYTLVAGTPLLLYAPTPADTSLSLVTGTINGSVA